MSQAELKKPLSLKIFVPAVGIFILMSFLMVRLHVIGAFEILQSLHISYAFIFLALILMVSTLIFKYASSAGWGHIKTSCVWALTAVLIPTLLLLSHGLMFSNADKVDLTALVVYFLGVWGIAAIPSTLLLVIMGKENRKIVKKEKGKGAFVTNPITLPIQLLLVHFPSYAFFYPDAAWLNSHYKSSYSLIGDNGLYFLILMAVFVGIGFSLHKKEAVEAKTRRKELFNQAWLIGASIMVVLLIILEAGSFKFIQSVSFIVLFIALHVLFAFLASYTVYAIESSAPLRKARKNNSKSGKSSFGFPSSYATSTLWLAFKNFKYAPVKLYGQEKTEASITKAIGSFDEDDGKPLSLLFCGASGVGKTQMAENLAEMTGVPLVQFNMADYGGGVSTHGSDISKDALIGLPSGYVGSESGGLLTNALSKDPTGIFLFDEMEKAGASVYDIFLNALDRGWLADARGSKHDCSKATFIFTTNIARDVDPELDDSKIRDKMVREGFRPELVGRLHKAIVFRPLTDEIACVVAKNELSRALVNLSERYDISVPNVAWHPEHLALRVAVGSTGYELYGVRVISKAMKEIATDIVSIVKDKDVKSFTIYPSKHGAPEKSVLKGSYAFSVGKDFSIDVDSLHAHMVKHVQGQDHAAKKIIEQIKMREMGLIAKESQPQGTYLFTGPSGTGKSELVKRLAENLGRKFITFNMGNFKGENGVEAFFGPPPGYVGSQDGGQLTSAVLDNPDAIILLDEIEKGNPKIWDAFMGVFDDGEAKDNSSGEMISFSNTMIFMTSNLVTEDVPQTEIRNYLRETGYFRPEMINRIENIVSFNPLGSDVKEGIVRKILMTVLTNYNKANGTNIQVKSEWVSRFTEKADFTHGARDIQRLIQKELVKEMVS